MTLLARSLCLLVLGVACLPLLAREYEGSRANSVLLNGAWEFAVGDGTEGAESGAGAPGLRWQPVTLPGPFMKYNQEKDYLVTEAREMSMNSFRTHTQPPPRLWCDISDEHGTMILAEFPVLYNYADYKFTPEEYEIWHRNVLTDAAGWMARLWNHPSVILWVLSNESRVDEAWEKGPFQDFVNALDPTRPTVRTGSTTRGDPAPGPGQAPAAPQGQP